jgi:hypothetical protein
MALIKKLSRFGYTAEYLALRAIESFCDPTREATFVFSLYKDKAAARDGTEPLVEKAARLRLTGEQFDRFFGAGVSGRDGIKAQAYAAARSLGVDSWGGKLSLTDAADD